MSDQPAYNELNNFGKCIVDKLLAKASTQARTQSMRDIVANYIDLKILPLTGKNTSGEVSVTITNGTAGEISSAEVKGKTTSIVYLPEVTQCIGEHKPSLPLTPDSVRLKPIMQK